MNRAGLEKTGVALLAVLAATGCLILAFILVTVWLRGAPVLDWEFVTTASSGFGHAGGVRYQILGTTLLMTGAALLCLPVALGSVLFQTEFLRSPRLKKSVRSLIYSLNAVPTILFGLMGYIVFGVLLDTGVSWWTGTLILAVMILPTLHVSLLEAVESIPVPYREAGLALGLTPGQLIRSVILPHSFYGLVTGTLLGLARAAGETAAILFTATVFSGVTVPQSLAEPVTTLQTHILVLAQEAIDPEAVAQAWGAAFVLLMGVMFLIALALVIRTRLSMEAQR
ncbi:PstA family ABC transporter permease [Nitrospina watsonii]|uniref:Phosphate transport system permease protein PstA (TC 3.A.1.7.1) n=1 Tax=Nitrospina watsonii TaxID=1323948 RepID=A0ABM9HBF2_9BACT|nr:ABC transporter permease subunit [Nitrospina watsonii]CAI2717455.1 Phosphate transport system permease protein PstA (TC 3.A.1.7.1) [Nitrospina watsonii]